MENKNPTLRMWGNIDEPFVPSIRSTLSRERLGVVLEERRALRHAVLGQRDRVRRAHLTRRDLLQRARRVKVREAHPHASTEATISAESVQAAREQPPRAEQLAADAAWFASTASVRIQDVGRLHDVEQRVMMGVAKNSVVHYQAIQDGTCPVPSSEASTT